MLHVRLLERASLGGSSRRELTHPGISPAPPGGQPASPRCAPAHGLTCPHRGYPVACPLPPFQPGSPRPFLLNLPALPWPLSLPLRLPLPLRLRLHWGLPLALARPAPSGCPGTFAGTAPAAPPGRPGPRCPALGGAPRVRPGAPRGPRLVLVRPQCTLQRPAADRLRSTGRPPGTAPVRRPGPALAPRGRAPLKLSLDGLSRPSSLSPSAHPYHPLPLRSPPPLP